MVWHSRISSLQHNSHRLLRLHHRVHRRLKRCRGLHGHVSAEVRIVEISVLIVENQSQSHRIPDGSARSAVTRTTETSVQTAEQRDLDQLDMICCLAE